MCNTNNEICDDKSSAIVEYLYLKSSVCKIRLQPPLLLLHNKSVECF